MNASTLTQTLIPEKPTVQQTIQQMSRPFSPPTYPSIGKNVYVQEKADPQPRTSNTSRSVGKIHTTTVTTTFKPQELPTEKGTPAPTPSQNQTLPRDLLGFSRGGRQKRSVVEGERGQGETSKAGRNLAQSKMPPDNLTMVSVNLTRGVGPVIVTRIVPVNHTQKTAPVTLTRTKGAGNLTRTTRPVNLTRTTVPFNRTHPTVPVNLT